MLYLLLLIEVTKMLFGFEKKNETSQSLREYAKNYLISEMSCFTVYFQSSKYATKLAYI